MLRPYLEKLPHMPGSSWSMLNRRLEVEIPFQWHHHPEYDLTLTLNSEGQRFIGDHVGAYRDADLVLVGPNLPHTWSSRRKLDERQPHVALVFWFHQDWIDNFLGGAVELKGVGALFQKAGRGLSFAPEAGRAIQTRFEAVFMLDPGQRLVQVLGILMELAEQKEVQALSSVFTPTTSDNRSRLDRVLNHLHQHYTGPIRIADLAKRAALSESGMHRLFTKHTQVTISEYITRLRIGDACARLSTTNQPIGHIATAVGYNNLANFNRQFRVLRQMTPSQYRTSFHP